MRQVAKYRVRFLGAYSILALVLLLAACLGLLAFHLHVEHHAAKPARSTDPLATLLGKPAQEGDTQINGQAAHCRTWEYHGDVVVRCAALGSAS